MADLSLDDVIRQRRIRFGNVNPNTTQGVANKGKIIKKKTIISTNKQNDARGKITLNKRMNLGDARQKLGVSGGNVMKKTGIKQRITLGTTGNQGTDARNKLANKKSTVISLKKNLQTPGRVNTSNVRRNVNDFQNQNFLNRKKTLEAYLNNANKPSAVMRQLTSIKGKMDQMDRMKNRTKFVNRSRPVQYVTEEVPVEYEVVDDPQDEALYEYDEVPTEYVVEEPISVRNVSRPIVRRQQRGRFQSRPQRSNYVQYQNGRQPRTMQNVDYVDSGFQQDVYAEEPMYYNSMNGASAQESNVYVNPTQNRFKRNVTTQRRSAPVFQQTAPPKKAISNVLRSRLEQTSSDPMGYKVTVSNLHEIVTLEDIKELFGNIGPLRDACMPFSGCAEVYFINEKDAQQAVKFYHQRKLDEQPMNVHLAKPQALATGGLRTQPRMVTSMNFGRGARGGRTNFAL